MHGASVPTWIERLRRRRSAAAAGVVALGLALFGLVFSCMSTPRPSGRPSWETAEKPSPTEPDVRIRVARSAERVTLAGPRELTLRAVEGAGGESAPMSAPVEVRLAGGAFEAKDGAGRTRAFARGAALAVSGAGPGLITIDGAPHPGTFELHARSDVSPGAFDVIEVTSIESYLPGVVAKELYATWSPAAYEAQAIAARTYALHERSRQRGLGSRHDLENTTADQAYGGATASSRAQDAVRKTFGQTLTTEGRLLRAYYSSTCGGRASGAREVWPTGPGFEFNLAAPIQAHDRACACGFSPLNRWSVVRSRDELVQRFAAFGRDQGLALRGVANVARIEPVRVNEVHRPTAYRVFDAEGKWWEVSAEQLRLACNHTAGGTLPEVGRQSRVNSGDVEVVVGASDVAINGRGFGHGVGLCQFGAEGFARQGRSAADILRHYYPGARVEQAYQR